MTCLTVMHIFSSLRFFTSVFWFMAVCVQSPALSITAFLLVPVLSWDHVMEWAHSTIRVAFKESVLSAWQIGETPHPSRDRVRAGLQLNHSAVRRSEVGGDWARGPPVRSDAPCISDSEPVPVRGGTIMATTTCTRFTDEYQLYEELGK